MSTIIPRSMLESQLPPEYENERLQQQVRAAVVGSRRKIIAIDDDPTGVQTVYDTAVLTTWDVAALQAELQAENSLFYILTNSRSLSEADAFALNSELMKNIAAASAITGVSFSIASRSDSTLRGHFPAETDAITQILGGVDAVLLCPAFFEGGRITVNDIHYVHEGDNYVPASETEFARDPVFGFGHSNLRDWIEEKTAGRIRSRDVASISIDDIRHGGPDLVFEHLCSVSNNQPIIINAASYQDLFVVALAVIEAEREGRTFVYRTAASFVRARAGLPKRSLLSREDLLGKSAPSVMPGLVVVGSYVRRSSEQLARCLELPETVGIEMRVRSILASGVEREQVILHAIAAVNEALRAGLIPVVYTSRQVEQGPMGTDPLVINRRVSRVLVDIVRGVDQHPGFIISKGGITSSDIGTEALGVRRAVVLGEIASGVPVWRLGPESRFPRLPYVIFPGNVGERDTLARLVSQLRCA